MCKSAYAIATVIDLLLVSPASACSPAPSCWMGETREYLRSVCLGYAKDHRTVAQIRSYLDNPAQVGSFVKACGKLHVYFR